MFNALAAIYFTGVAIGLIVMRDRWSERLITAALWPLGLLALLVVTVTLVGASAYLWPAFGIALLLVGAALWLLL